MRISYRMYVSSAGMLPARQTDQNLWKSTTATPFQHFLTRRSMPKSRQREKRKSRIYCERCKSEKHFCKHQCFNTPIIFSSNCAPSLHSSSPSFIFTFHEFMRPSRTNSSFFFGIIPRLIIMNSSGKEVLHSVQSALNLLVHSLPPE